MPLVLKPHPVADHHRLADDIVEAEIDRTAAFTAGTD
jgi:hypothetical protein